jgi:predicted Holliday junction resolvase-like endonuclease
MDRSFLVFGGMGDYFVESYVFIRMRSLGSLVCQRTQFLESVKDARIRFQRHEGQVASDWFNCASQNG